MSDRTSGTLKLLLHALIPRSHSSLQRRYPHICYSSPSTTLSVSALYLLSPSISDDQRCQRELQRAHRPIVLESIESFLSRLDIYTRIPSAAPTPLPQPPPRLSDQAAKGMTLRYYQRRRSRHWHLTLRGVHHRRTVPTTSDPNCEANPPRQEPLPTLWIPLSLKKFDLAPVDPNCEENAPHSEPTPIPWIPLSLRNFDLTPSRKSCPVPLVPILPSPQDGEERNSFCMDDLVGRLCSI